MAFEVILAVSVLLFVLLSFVLEYHWRTYAHRSNILFLARLFYYGGSLVFFLMTLSLIVVDTVGFVRS